jgi:hypothetical protein
MAKSLRKRKKKVVVMYAIAMHIYIIPHILFIVLDLTLEYEHDPSFSEDGPVRMSQSSLAIQFPRTRNAHLPTIDVVNATAAVALTHAHQSPHTSLIDRITDEWISPANLLARPYVHPAAARSLPLLVPGARRRRYRHRRLAPRTCHARARRPWLALIPSRLHHLGATAGYK